MKLSAILALGLSSITRFSDALPSNTNLVAKNANSSAALRTVYTADSADKVFGDFLMRSNGTFLTTSSNSNKIPVIDPDQGIELSNIAIPGVTGTFGIASLGFYPDEAYFVVGGNITVNGEPVNGSFSIFEITISTSGDGFYDTQVHLIAPFPSTAISPTGSLALSGDYAYIADTARSSILTYQLSTSSFTNPPSLFPASPLLTNPQNCPIEVGVNGLAVGHNTPRGEDFTLWFSNQVQALTGSIALSEAGAPAGDFVANARQVQTQGSSATCVFVSWGRFALDEGDGQWVVTSEGTVVRAGVDGRYQTVVSGLREPRAVVFGVTEATKKNLYIVTKGEEGGSEIQVFDTTSVV